MNNFSLQCEKIIEDMLLEAKAVLDPFLKSEIREDIKNIIEEKIPSIEKATRLKAVKKKLFSYLWKINYKKIRSFYTTNADGEPELPSTNVKKVTDIVEGAIESLASEDDRFRLISKSHIAESFKNTKKVL